MCGEDPLVEEGAKSLKQGNKNAKQGVQSLKQITKDFESDPRFAKLGDFLNQILEQPETYTPELKDSLKNNIASQGISASEDYGANLSGMSERLGLSRSQAGGQGFSQLAALGGLGASMQAGNQVDIMAAQDRVASLNRAINTGFSFLREAFAPKREEALGQLGTLGGLSQLAGASAQLAKENTTAGEFGGQVAGQLIGSAAGAAGAMI